MDELTSLDPGGGEADPLQVQQTHRLDPDAFREGVVEVFHRQQSTVGRGGVLLHGQVLGADRAHLRQRLLCRRRVRVLSDRPVEQVADRDPQRP